MPTQPKSKKSVVKTIAVPKYKLGQKIYSIIIHKGMPEELVEGEIYTVRSREYDLRDGSGNKTGVGHSFSYTVITRTVPIDVQEGELFPNFTEAAKAFATPFLTLLK